MRRFGVLITLLLTLTLGAGAAEATSLWGGGVSLFSDLRAQRVGDLVTLIIVEQSRAEQRASTTLGQESSISLGPGGGLLSGFIPDVSLGGGDDRRAGGTTARGGTLEARVTTQVVEILPNGAMVIQGYQMIQVNGEMQILRVSGIIRPQDIRADNTVLSTYVANAEIVFQGTGQLAAKQQPGLLTRFFNWLF